MWRGLNEKPTGEFHNNNGSWLVCWVVSFLRETNHSPPGVCKHNTPNGIQPSWTSILCKGNLEMVHERTKPEVGKTA